MDYHLLREAAQLGSCSFFYQGIEPVLSLRSLLQRTVDSARSCLLDATRNEELVHRSISLAFLRRRMHEAAKPCLVHVKICTVKNKEQDSFFCNFDELLYRCKQEYFSLLEWGEFPERTSQPIAC